MKNGSVLVIDDHPLVLDAMQHLIESLGMNVEVLATNSAETGLALLKEITNLRMIVLDFNLPWISGNEAVKIYHSRYPDIPIVVLSGTAERHTIMGALRFGAKAYISKASAPDRILDLFRRVLSGDVVAPEWIIPSTSLQPENAFNRQLTERQQCVLEYMMKGHSNKEIAFLTGLAEITIKMHVTAIFRALKVVNRTQAVMMAQKIGLGGSETHDGTGSNGDHDK